MNPWIQILAVVVASSLVGCATAKDAARFDNPTTHGATDTVRPEALYAQGLAWARRGDLVRAEQYMALSVRAGLPAERALVAIVDACLQASRLGAALAYAEPYARRHPEAWKIHLLLASIHAALGRHERALADLRRVTAEPAAHANAHYMLATLLDERFGDAPGARRAFRAYLARAPRGPHASEASRWLAEHEPRSETLTEARP